MSRKINIEVLNLLGAKTFVNVMAVGASAFPSAVSETINLAYNTLGQEENSIAVDSALSKALAANSNLYAAALVIMAKGLASQGESGVKTAILQVYESVFAAAGLPTYSIFKQGLEEEDAPIPPAALDLTAHVTKTVLKCISDQLGVRLADIKPTHGLVRNLGADSLDLIELTMYIEDELHIEISDELAERVVTVQNVIDTAIQLRREQGPTGN